MHVWLVATLHWVFPGAFIEVMRLWRARPTR